MIAPPQTAVFRLYMALSLDGYIADSEGGVDWLNDFETGVDYGTDAFMAEVDTLIMGRATFDQIVGFGAWPYAGKRCFVLTSRPIAGAPDGVEGTSDLAGLIAELREAGSQVWIVGGPIAVDGCRAMGALDTVELFIMPVLLGSGIPLFAGEVEALALRLVDSRTFETGAVALRYEVE
jgi:dihydrofolate reductase